MGVVVDALAGGRDRLRELVEGRVAAIEALLGNLESIGVDEFVGILVNLFGKALLQEVLYFYLSWYFIILYNFI